MTILPTSAKVLKWAREIRRVALDDAAEKLEWDVDHLRAVEDGKVPLDQATLQRMAVAYKLPLATLLMPEPLNAERYGPRPITDFRLHVRGQAKLTPATARYIENAWELLELVAELGERANLVECTIRDSAEQIALAERARLGIPVIEQLGWDNERTAFLNWRTALEDDGVIVNALNIKEPDVRGFALYYEGAGYVAVNKNEQSDRAKIYSLFHEYAHLLLRQSGISDQNRSVPVERWCNQFAANFLLPAADVRRFCDENNLLAGQLGDWQVNRVSSNFKVSKSAVAIRLEELGLAPAGFYERLKANWHPPKPNSGFDPDGDQVKKELNRYGTRHVGVVLSALDAGRIDRVEARYALDVNPEYHRQMMNAAAERRVAYGRKRAG